MATTATPTAEVPWWLDDAGETCAVCLETYAYEVEVRCAECDEPLCPHCAGDAAIVVRRERRVVCSPCTADPAGADDSGETA